MSHIEAAVTYWNREGYLTGPRSDEVYAFMRNPANYILERSSTTAHDRPANIPAATQEAMTELPDDAYDGVKQLSATGDARAQERRYREAISWYRRALDLLPPPVTRWDAATWIYAAVTHAAFLTGDALAALEALDSAMESPNSFGNPFLHLRRGQALFDLGRKEEAANELTRAYMVEDEDIFDDEDPKYLKFLRSVLRPPAKR